MKASRIVAACIWLVVGGAVADDVFVPGFVDDLSNLLKTKTKMLYNVGNHTYRNSWVSKGELYEITASGQIDFGYYVYVMNDEESITSESFYNITSIFQKEGLANLKTDAIFEIVDDFLCRSSFAGGNNKTIINKSMLISYRNTIESGLCSESDITKLEKLVGKDGAEFIRIKNNPSSGRWSASGYAITAGWKVESWEFSGENTETKFTVDSLSRKLLDISVNSLWGSSESQNEPTSHCVMQAQSEGKGGVTPVIENLN